jgi:hypothetical protein
MQFTYVVNNPPDFVIGLYCSVLSQCQISKILSILYPFSIATLISKDTQVPSRALSLSECSQFCSEFLAQVAHTGKRSFPFYEKVTQGDKVYVEE